MPLQCTQQQIDYQQPDKPQVIFHLKLHFLQETISLKWTLMDRLWEKQTPRCTSNIIESRDKDSSTIWCKFSRCSRCREEMYGSMVIKGCSRRRRCKCSSTLNTHNFPSSTTPSKTPTKPIAWHPHHPSESTLMRSKEDSSPDSKPWSKNANKRSKRYADKPDRGSSSGRGKSWRSCLYKSGSEVTYAGSSMLVWGLTFDTYASSAECSQ